MKFEVLALSRYLRDGFAKRGFYSFTDSCLRFLLSTPQPIPLYTPRWLSKVGCPKGYKLLSLLIARLCFISALASWLNAHGPPDLVVDLADWAPQSKLPMAVVFIEQVTLRASITLLNPFK